MVDERDPIKAAEGQLELARNEARDKGPHYLEAFQDAQKIGQADEARRVKHNIMASLENEHEFNAVFKGYAGFANFGIAARKQYTETEKCDMALKLLDLYGKEVLNYAKAAKGGSVAEHSQVCTQAGTYLEMKGELLEKKAFLLKEAFYENEKKADFIAASEALVSSKKAFHEAASWWAGSNVNGMLHKEYCEESTRRVTRKEDEHNSSRMLPSESGKVRGKS